MNIYTDMNQIMQDILKENEQFLEEQRVRLEQYGINLHLSYEFTKIAKQNGDLNAIF